MAVARLSKPTGVNRAHVSRSARRVSFHARRTVQPVAGFRDMADWVSEGFLRIFSPPTDNGVNWKGTMNSFGGRIDIAKKPFKEGVVPAASGCTDARAENYDANAVIDDGSCLLPAEVRQQQDGYLEGAVGRVMSNNFKGDGTEPDWDANKAAGWSGDIHAGRDRDRGFHSKVH